jgi:hypothetical protein
MPKWKDCILKQYTKDIDQILELQYLPVFWVEEIGRTSESLNKIKLLYDMISEYNKILFTVDIIKVYPIAYKSINLRSYKSSHPIWSKLIMSPDISDSYKYQTFIRQVDIITSPGVILKRSLSKISGRSINIFNMDLDIFTGSSKDQEYTTIKYNEITNWSDTNTQVIRGTDNEHLKELVGLRCSNT